MTPMLKVCGVRTVEDARRAVDMGADYIGLILYPRSPRFIHPERVPEVLAEIPGGKRVMVDVSTPSDQLEKLGDLGFDFFQIHFDLDLSLASLAAWSGIVGSDSLWLAPRIPEGDAFPQVILEFADTIVLDTYSKDGYGGSGRASGWERFAEWKTLYQHKQFVLAGGLNPDNIAAAIAATSAEVVDVNSGVEKEPGVKDFEKLAQLIASLKQAALKEPSYWE